MPNGKTKREIYWHSSLRDDDYNRHFITLSNHAWLSMLIGARYYRINRHKKTQKSNVTFLGIENDKQYKNKCVLFLLNYSDEISFVKQCYS